MNIAGNFEIHWTVRMDGSQQLSALQMWAAERDLKCTHIVLERGQTPSQPMLTRHARGTLAGIIDDSRGMADAMRAAGFDVSRIKAEVATDSRDVPQTESDAAKRGPQHYFEHHVKLLLPRSADMGPIIAAVKPHGAHVSRNALRARADGRQERFVTQRCYRVSKATARGKLDALLATLRDQTFEIIDLEEEYVVFDSNTALDAGWIEPG